MNRDRKICKDPTCYAFGSFCKRPGHTDEVITPYVKPKKIGDKLKEEQKKYSKARRIFITQHPRCQVSGCTKISEHIHHRAGRLGELLTDVKNFMAVCPEHHHKIETEPDWAKENGYSESRLKVS